MHRNPFISSQSSKLGHSSSKSINGYLLKMTSVQLLFIIVVLFHGIESIDPIVGIPGQGLVQGIKMTTLGGKTIRGFLGVPYAKPPVGDLRFLEPQPPKPFIGVWNASHFRPQCLQYRHILPPGHDKVYGDEDCLYANIYTPEIPMSGEKKSYDVIINFHGGAFMFGSGEFYGPKYLLDRDVILVSINYRLGPLGFLSLEDEIAPGNNGMKDQVAAMKWTKDNIAVFGGNPNSIHLIGLSAGGASVHLHYLSPLSKGLFKSGISMSGTALCPWALVEKSKEKAMKLAAIVGCPTNINSYELLKCLRHRPAADLVSAMSNFQIWLYNPFSPFGPVVEPKNVKGKAFLPDDPFILLSNGKVQNLPWMTGVTSHEGLYPASDWVADDDLMDQFSSHFEDLIPHILHFNDTAAKEELKQISSKIRKFYFGNRVIGKGDREEVIKLCSDRLFLIASDKAAKLQAKYSNVYQYEFKYRGKYSLSEALAGTDVDLGVSHGDDTTYIMNLSFITEFDQSDKPVSELMLNIVTSFIQKGKPELNGVVWKEVKANADELDYLEIKSANDFRMLSSTDFGNKKFWNSLRLDECDNLKKNRDEL